jgi:serine/threonine protein kinase
MYMDKYQLSVTPEIQQIIRRYSHHHTHHQDDDSQFDRSSRLKQWYAAWIASNDTDEDVIPSFPPKDGIDLLNQLLVYDPDDRLSAKEAMQHPFFDAVRETILAQHHPTTFHGS